MIKHGVTHQEIVGYLPHTHTHYNCSLPAAVGPNGVAKMAKRAWSEVATDYDVPSLVTETVPESAVPPTGPEES